MKIRRILALVCLLTLLSGLLAFPAGAVTDTAEQAILNSCLSGETVDISAYSLSPEQLSALFFKLYDEGKLPWYTTSDFSYSYRDDNNTIVSFVPNNLDAAQYDRIAYEERLAQVMDACVLEGMTPEQIALSVHDYLVLNTVYDESLKAGTAYDLLINGTTVCAGYTAVYMDILNRVGIPCVRVTSEPMEHTWNLVQLDGKWYHVDVTWDDPAPDVSGYVSHQYFLVTDEQIAEGDKPHYDWVTDTVCNDTRYENAYWRELTSAILFSDNSESYLMRSEEFTNRIYRRDETGQETLIYTDADSTLETDQGTYAYYHTGLALRDGRLWFGTLDEVCSIDTTGNDLRTEYTYDTAESQRYIYSFSVNEDSLLLTTADHEGTLKSHRVSLHSSEIPHAHSYTQQAVDGDCSEAGYTLFTCQCGLSFKTNWVLSDHAYAATGDGSQEACTLCGYTRPTLQQTQTPSGDPVTVEIPYAVIAGAVIAILLLILLLRPKKKKRR